MGVNRPRDKLSQKEKIKQITEQLEAGVIAVFESDRYADYLKCMSKFHSFSLNNCLLIALQKPDATLCCSYVGWQRDHGRHVKKGEKGIKIIAPCKYKTEVEDEQHPGEKKVVEHLGFKVAYTYDLAQTEGRELPSIGPDELKGDVRDYRRIFDALVSISPVPIYSEDIQGGAKGYYNDSEKRIAIKAGMSELQTIKTLAHEIAHATYHCSEAQDKDHPLDRKHKETEAESIAMVLTTALSDKYDLDIDTSDYSFPYIAAWAAGKDTTVLKESLERIRSASDEMITGISAYMENQPGINTIAFHLDSDFAGRSAARSIKEQLKDRFTIRDEPPPIGNDYNDYLKAIQRKERSRQMCRS